MLRTCGLVIAVALLMTACGGGGGEAMPAPSNLQYALGTGVVGSPYGPYPPSVSGTVTGYSVNPALPAGLTLDPTSGVISGTPVAASSGTYTVTASNAGGTATAVLTLEVRAPGHRPIESGTPNRERTKVTYTIIARNSGSPYTHADLVLAVGPPPVGTAVTGVLRSDTVIGLGYVSGTHSGLTDKSGAFTYEEGQGITFSVGAVSIGAVPTTKNLVTPVDLVAQGTGTSNHVLNVVRFLMMLDEDGNPNNGIQISAAVTAAAASWAPVDFDTADLPTTLGPLIQEASAADGVSHVLPDAATAQAHLRTGFYCTHAGNYYGTFAADSTPGLRSSFEASVLPDGSMDSAAHGDGVLTGFRVQTNDALSPALDGTFVQSAVSPTVGLQGSFADATYLSGSYLADVGGIFQAVADASVAATYKFTGSYTVTPNDPTASSPYSGPVNFGMDDSNQVSGRAVGSLVGTVSGNTFTGTVGIMHEGHYPVSGTYSNTASGVTLDGQYSTPDSVITFSTVGCRAN